MIFYFVRVILRILDSFRYFSSSESFNYHFLASFQMVIQIYNPFGMQEFYHRKEKRNLYVRWCYAFLSCVKISFATQVLKFSETHVNALFMLKSSGWNLLVMLCSMITISQLFLAKSFLKLSLSCPFILVIELKFPIVGRSTLKSVLWVLWFEAINCSLCCVFSHFLLNTRRYDRIAWTALSSFSFFTKVLQFSIYSRGISSRNISSCFD